MKKIPETILTEVSFNLFYVQESPRIPQVSRPCDFSAKPYFFSGKDVSYLPRKC